MCVNQFNINRIIASNRSIWTFFLFLILLLPNFSVLFLCTEISLFNRLVAVFFAGMIWLIPALFLKAKTFFRCMGLFLIPALLEIGCAWINKTTLTDGIFSAVFNTDWHECIELITPFRFHLWSYLAVCVIYYWICESKIENENIFTVRGRRIILMSFLTFNFLLMGGMYFLASKQTEDFSKRWENAQDSYWKKYKKIFPVDVLYLSCRTFDTNRKIRSMRDAMKDFSFQAAKRDTLSQNEIYVLIIGESARYDHFGLNGYERQTTPLLSNLSNLYSFSDVYSMANLTEYALPMILSRATPHTFGLQYQEKTLSDAFQEAGFFTSWFANQGDNYPFVQRIAKDSDESEFIVTSFNSPSSQDEYLLPILDRSLKHKEKKRFIVLHTHGSHFQYDMRYPKSFGKFQPTLEQKILLDESDDCKRRLINSYDNTLLYTDYFINEVIRRLQQQDAVCAMIYLSDHAESLYDGDNRQVLHGNNMPTREEIHVPLLVWVSESYKQTYADKICQLKKNLDQPLSSTYLFDSFLDLANIHYPGENLQESFVSPFFKTDSVRPVYTPSLEVVDF